MGQIKRGIHHKKSINSDQWQVTTLSGLDSRLLLAMGWNGSRNTANRDLSDCNSWFEWVTGNVSWRCIVDSSSNDGITDKLVTVTIYPSAGCRFVLWRELVACIVRPFWVFRRNRLVCPTTVIAIEINYIPITLILKSNAVDDFSSWCIVCPFTCLKIQLRLFS